MKNKIYDALIIGGGPAGMFAGIYGYQKKLNLALVEKDKLGGDPLKSFPNKPINDFPSYPTIKTKTLMNKFIDQLTKHTNVSVFTNTEIISYTLKNKIFNVTLSNKKIIKAKNLIIAIGKLESKPEKIKTNKDFRIQVKQNQLTCINHVYAIGNICFYLDKPSSMSTACGEATVAVRSIKNSLNK